MQRPKGTKDIYGDNASYFSLVYNELLETALSYNFKQIDTPIFEHKEVFSRTVGETTDIVSKEMFEFKDKKGREMVLRPEGTAGVIRAVVENKLYANLPLKLFYIGPMFRYENPQKGRQRQFTQFGIEYLANKEPYRDVETISMANSILNNLGIKNKLIINSIGDKETREKYSLALKEYFKDYKDQLSPISQQRLETNPMRILDDKVDSQKDFVINAPKISNFYSEEVNQYYNQVKELLDSLNIKYIEKPTLVRGIDYYTDIVFEFESLSEDAGSQSTLIAGGRYENLVRDFGGPDISGVGFALGIERIVSELEKVEIENAIAVTIINLDKESLSYSMQILEELRSNGLISELLTDIKLTKALEKADKQNSIIKLLIGNKEKDSNLITIKTSEGSKEITREDIVDYIFNNFEGGFNEEN